MKNSKIKMVPVVIVTAVLEEMKMGLLNGPSFVTVRSLINAETAALIAFPDGMVMMIDEDGEAKKLPVNRAATELRDNVSLMGKIDIPILGDAVILSKEVLDSLEYEHKGMDNTAQEIDLTGEMDA